MRVGRQRIESIHEIVVELHQYFASRHEPYGNTYGIVLKQLAIVRASVAGTRRATNLGTPLKSSARRAQNITWCRPLERINGASSSAAAVIDVDRDVLDRERRVSSTQAGVTAGVTVTAIAPTNDLFTAERTASPQGDENFGIETHQLKGSGTTWSRATTPNRISTVELRGIEPLASTVRLSRSTN